MRASVGVAVCALAVTPSADTRLGMHHALTHSLTHAQEQRHSDPAEGSVRRCRCVYASVRGTNALL